MMGRPEPTEGWTLVDIAQPDVPLSTEARAWQRGPITVLVLDFPNCWGVSVTAGMERATDEQFATVRRDFGLGDIEEAPEREGARYLFVDEPRTFEGVSHTFDLGPPGVAEYVGATAVMPLSSLNVDSVDFGAASVVGLDEDGDAMPISGPVVVLADLPAEVVALRWTSGGEG